MSQGCLVNSRLGRARPKKSKLRTAGFLSALLFLPATPATPGERFSVCGDSIIESSSGEECDDGNVYGGDGCAANCTHETDFEMVFEADGNPPSSIVIQAQRSAWSLGITGRRVVTRGSAHPSFGAGETNFLPGEIPIATVIAKNQDLIPPIAVPGLACVCLRQAELRSCGGRMVYQGKFGILNGTGCNEDESVCERIGAPPCGLTFGPGVSAAGRISCDGETLYTNFTHGIESVTGDEAFYGGGNPAPAGSVVNITYGSIGLVKDGGTCSVDTSNIHKGRDGIPCTRDDPAESRGKLIVVVEATGELRAIVGNANNDLAHNISPDSMCDALPCFAAEHGVPARCDFLQAGRSEGLCLASAVAILDQAITKDAVVVSRVCSALPPSCRGDCNGSDDVSLDELLLGVEVVLERAPMSTCRSLAPVELRAPSVVELVAAVLRSRGGC